MFTISLSVGYAALNGELKISGEATFRVEEDIRITNVELYETTNLGLENYNSKFGKDSISLGVDLKQLNSTVTYKVTILNTGTVSMWIDSINQEIKNNTNMEYTLEGIGLKDLINSGEETTFNLTIKYKDGITLPSNTNLDTMIKFNFIKPQSILAQGTSGNGTTTFFNSGPITKESVESITFQPTLEVGENALGFWDASYNKDMTVIAWYTDNDNNDLYELNIGGIGEVYAPVNSSHLFRSFINIENISFNEYFNTSNVTNMSVMFRDCSSLPSIDVSNFDTSQVTNMGDLFYGCSSLTQLDVSNFKTDKVTNMSGMFNGCSNLTELDVSNFVTSQVTNMQNMFHSCKLITKLDVSNFVTDQVTNMSGMFYGCALLTNLDVSKFSTEKVNNFSWMFNSCSSLISLDVTKFNTNNATKMGQMFQNCSKLKSINVSNFNTSKVTSMESMFNGCKLIEFLDLSNFNTIEVTNMLNMFSGCLQLTELNISNFDTSSVTTMQSMFYNCSSLISLDLSNFTFNKVTNNTSMFSGIPKTALITVKDQTAKDYILGLRSDLTNIQIVSEV